MGCWYTHVSRITYRTYHVCRAGAEAADSRALLTVIHTYTVRCRYRLSAEHITAVPPPCVHRSLSGREAHHTQLPQKCNPTTAAFENLSETQSSFQRICGGGCIFPTKYPLSRWLLRPCHWRSRVPSRPACRTRLIAWTVSAEWQSRRRAHRHQRLSLS